MKTSKRNRSVTIMIGILLLIATVSNAQRNRYQKSYYSSPKYFIAVESSVGTTSLRFKSDIEDLSNLKFDSQGWSGGVILGNDAVKLRLTYGQYSFQKSFSQSIDQNLLSANINLSPVRYFQKLKYFRAYLITGVDYGMFSFDGITVPKYINPNPPSVAASAQKCCCETASSSEAGQGEPEVQTLMADSEPDTVNPKSLVLNKAQINTGLGMEFTVTKNKRFYRMFAQAHYGIPMNEIINDLSLNKTKLSGQMVINIGFSLGIAPNN
jgi:hypothetical protein